MPPFFKRNLFKFYLYIRVELLWFKCNFSNFERINSTCRRIDNWNKNFLDFQLRFPLLNSKVFIENYKYWIHWTTKMDVREKLVFINSKPIVQLNEEDWIHFDFSTKTMSISYLSFDFSINEWVKIDLFSNMEQFEEYISCEENSAESLMKNVQNICRKMRMERMKNKLSNQSSK